MFKTTYKPVSEYKKKARFITTHAVKPKGAYEWCILAVRIKNRHKDHILFFRLGDFYEMFFDDAILASKELELTLTGRDCGQEERAPMCGIPYHSSEAYIQRLLEK